MRRPPNATEKPCTRCGRPQPLSEFKPNKRMLDGRSSWCHACQNASTRAWRARVRVEYNARRRVRYEPRACVGCGLVFTPNRVDKRYCCHLCGDISRYGQPGPAWAAAHRGGHEAHKASEALAARA